MFDWFKSCGIWSSEPKAGQYALEAYPQTVAASEFSPSYNLHRPQHSHERRSTRTFAANDSSFEQLYREHPKPVIRKVIKSNYADLLRKHDQSGEKFKDPDFPANDKSIGKMEDMKIRACWKRIPDIVKSPQFMRDPINPSELLQGSSGDCYLLSAVAALAEDNRRISALFGDTKMNPHGIYMARIMHLGNIREVVVDDYIPVNESGQPLFAKPTAGRQVWVMILEKCWAKLNGSYGEIVGGLPNQTLHAFSAAPTYSIDIPKATEKREELWVKINQAHTEGAVLSAATCSTEGVEKSGLVRGHAYSVLTLYQSPYRMVRLRNPWLKRQWCGRAAENDHRFWSSISPADKQRLGYSSNNSGTFLMLWDDFVNYFFLLDICMVNPNASISSMEVFFQRKNAQMFQFEAGKGDFTIMLSQKTVHSGRAYLQNRFIRSVMVVGRQDEAAEGYEYKYIESSSSGEAIHKLQLRGMGAGKYVVYTKFYWNEGKGQTAGITVHSQTPVNLKQKSQSQYPKFLYKVLLDHARHNPKKQPLGNSPNDWVCHDLLLDKCGFGYLAFHLNHLSQKKLGVQIDENDYTEKRFQLKKPYRGRGVIRTSVEAGKELIILFKIQSQKYPNSVTLPAPKVYNLV